MLKNELSLILEGIEIVIKRKKVLRYLGYRRKEVKGEVEEILAKEMEEGRHLVSPQVIYSRQTLRMAM